MLKVTGKVIFPPSIILASAIVISGAASLSNIVPTAVSVVSPAVPESTLPTAIVKVSSNSSIVSTVVGTTTLAVVSPAGIVIWISVVV